MTNAEQIVEFQLAQGMSPRAILLAYYRVQKTADANDCFRILARLSPGWFKEIAEEAKLKLTDIIMLFKDSRVVKVFKAIGWSFTNLYKLFKTGYRALNDLQKALMEYAKQSGIGRWTAKQLDSQRLRDIDNWLKSHPKTKRITGAVVAGILAYIWWNMTFVGNPAFDFNMSDMLSALAGSFSLENIFSGSQGATLLLLFFTGSVGLSFPWPGPNKIKFAVAVLGTLAAKLRKRMRKASITAGYYRTNAIPIAEISRLGREGSVNPYLNTPPTKLKRDLKTVKANERTAKMDEYDYRRTMNGFAFDSNGNKDYVQFYKDNPEMRGEPIFGRLPIIHVLYYAEWTDYKVFKTIKALLDMGEDPNSMSMSNEYAADVAYNQGRTEVYELLKSKGGKAPIGDRKEEEFERQWAQKQQDDAEREQLKRKPETFALGGMTITNAGVATNDMKKMVSALNKVMGRIRQFGFGHLLYGPVIIVPDKLDGKTWDVSAQKYQDIKAAALYSSSRDWVTINADYFLRDRGNSMKTFAHELGHRQWFKFMDATQRKWWRGEYEERGVKITKGVMKHVISVVEWAAPQMIDGLGNTYPDWSEFDYNKFVRKMRQSQKKYHALDALDAVAVKRYKGAKATARKSMIQYHTGVMANETNRMSRIAEYLDTGDDDVLNARERRKSDEQLRDEYDTAMGHYEGNHRIFQNAMYSGVGQFLESPTSTSEYGRSNDKEDYAEAFGHYMANKPMPAGIHDLFMSVSGLRKAAANPYLNTPPTELARKIKTEKDPAKKRQMQTALNAWRITVPGPFRKTAADMASKFISKVRSWGDKNPLNHREIVIDDVVGLELVDAYDEVYLQHIRAFDKGKGHASRILKKTLKLADDLGVILKLNAKSTGDGLTTKQLVKWYTRHGFESEGGGDMVRYPKGYDDDDGVLRLGPSMREISIASDIVDLAKLIIF